LSPPDFDLRVRNAAFDWLAIQTEVHGGYTLPWPLLLKGFTFEGNRIPLASPQGIHKPRILDLPISIRSVLDGPYADQQLSEGLIAYKYRGENPNHRDNVGLRRLMETRRPLIFFLQVVKGQYLPNWPCYIIHDDPASLTFDITIDQVTSVEDIVSAPHQVAEDLSSPRAYSLAIVKRRIHQASFRERVLAAYRIQCAFCRLRHRELLDAAHIRPDVDPQGHPTVDNGLSLCKLHHAAFDSFILGVTPDYVIRVREDVLDEEDGPLLRVGLQDLEGARLLLPSEPTDQPNREALAWRYEQFIVAK
jgi:putative restriction endonuclease